MQDNKIAGLITAAGYGQLNNGRSKLTETFLDKSIVGEVVEHAQEAGLEPIVLVVNERFRPAIEETLKSESKSNLHFVVQRHRKGAANSVFRAIPKLRELSIENFVVIFGDMPNISTEHIKTLSQAHLEGNNAVTYSYWECNRDNPVAQYMQNYVYLSEGDNGQKVHLYEGVIPPNGTRVFSSLFAFKTEDYYQLYRKGVPHRKIGDPFHSEYHLPKLIEVANKEGLKSFGMEWNRPAEFVGVNNLEQLEIVRGLRR